MPSPKKISRRPLLGIKPATPSLDIYSPSGWRRVWRSILEHEHVWTSIAAKTTDPAAVKMLRDFYAFWDPIYTKAMDIDDFLERQPSGSIPTDYIDQTLQGFALARQKARLIGLGRDRTGTYWPRIDPLVEKTLAESLPHPTTSISGDNAMTIPASFRASITGQLDGEILTLRACHRGRCYQTAIDLAPIAAQVNDMIRRYHAHVLHGDMREETVAGLGDWYRSAVKTAARIANAKAARKLWEAVQEHHGKLEAGLTAFGPVGAAAAIGMRTGFTVQKMLAKAKSGDPVAVDDVRRIVGLAKQGDPNARKVHAIMRNLNLIAKRKDADADADEENVAGWLYNRPYRVAAVGPGLALRGIYNLGLAAA